jgi:methylmalonyl-CoA mutase cobalamin-binding subunit
MSPRDTRTGEVMEQMVVPAMVRGGYEFRRKIDIGRRLGRGRHIVDGIAEKSGRRILVSLKWQQVSGTTEQKVPFEVISLIEARRAGGFDAAYVVLGGQKWRFKEVFLEHGLDEFIPAVHEVQIVTLEDFVARANQGRL